MKDPIDAIFLYTDSMEVVLRLIDMIDPDELLLMEAHRLQKLIKASICMGVKQTINEEILRLGSTLSAIEQCMELIRRSEILMEEKENE